MESYFGFLARLLTKSLEFRTSHGCDATGRCCGPVFPGANNEDCQKYAENQRHKRHHPGHPVETCRWRCSQHGRSILLHETLQRKVVAVAAIKRSHQFAAHAIGIRAAHVVALQQNLAAAAGAHQAMTEIAKPGGVACTHESDKGNR